VLRDRAALERYLEQLEQRDQQDEVVIERSALLKFQRRLPTSEIQFLIALLFVLH
jgi:hypothetical protein